MATQSAILTGKFVSTNPANGEVLAAFECATEIEVNNAVERARAAQPAWGSLPVQQRVAVLQRFQRILLQNKAAVAELITREAGKPLPEALLTEVLVVLDAARFLIENVASFLRDEAVPHGNLVMKAKSGRVIREPYGVVGIISPWNYPLSIPATESLAALATGNAVVLKPSESTPLIALELAAMLHAAGVPRDVFQVVLGEGPTGGALVNAAIDKLVFTGSAPTGRRIAQAAAPRFLPVVLELGGKDPMLILDDADLDVASSAAVWGAFTNAGQACLSVERCYVHRSLYQRFLDACVEKTRKLHLGNGLDPATDVGPMIHPRQLQIVESQVEEARQLGATVLTGGAAALDIGPNFYPPTVLADVTHHMRVMREETFGPVLPIMPFDDDDSAIAMANDCEYGLAASIWTTNRARGEALARKINAGTVMVNDVLSCFGISEAPHGGIKASGLGSTHGRYGLAEMVHLKYVDSDLTPKIKKLWWYGYGPGMARQMEGFLDSLFTEGTLSRLAGAVRSAGALTRKNRM